MILFVASAVTSFCIAMYIAHYRLVGTVFESKWSFTILYPIAIGVCASVIVLTFVVTNISPNEFAFNFVSNLYSSLGAEVFLGIFAGLFGQQWLKAAERRNLHDPKTDEHKVAARTARNQSIIVAVMVLAALLVQDSARIFELLKGVQTPVFSVEFNQLVNEQSRSSARIHTPEDASGDGRATSGRGDHPAVSTGILTGLKSAVNRDDNMISKLVKPYIEAAEKELVSLQPADNRDSSTAVEGGTQPKTEEEKEKLRQLQEKIKGLDARLAALKDRTVYFGRKSLLPNAAIAVIEDYASPLGACLSGLEIDLKHEFFLLTQISAFAESVWSINREVQNQLDSYKNKDVKALNKVLVDINRSGSEFIYNDQVGNNKSLFASAIALARQVYNISERHGAPCENLDMADNERLNKLRSNAKNLAEEFSIHRPYLPLVASALLAFVDRPEAAVLELNRYIDTLDKLKNLKSEPPLPVEFVAQLEVYRTRAVVVQSSFMRKFNRGRAYIETEIRNIETIDNTLPPEVTSSFLRFAKTGDGDFCTIAHSPFHRLQLVRMFREGNFVEAAINHPDFMDVYASQALIVGERNVNVKLECIVRLAFNLNDPTRVQQLAAYYGGDFARIYAKLMLQYTNERRRLRIMPANMYRTQMSKTESVLDIAIQKLGRFAEEDDHRWEQAPLAQKLAGPPIHELHSKLKRERRKIRDILLRL